MVALSQEFKLSGKDPQRFLPRHHTHRLGAARCSTSNTQGNLREATYAECDRLESCSKDPIGYRGSEWNPYEYVNSVPLNRADPSGLIPITCECGCWQQRGSDRIVNVTTECGGLAANCCSLACGSVGRTCPWTGSYKIVPGPDAFDDAKDDYESAICDIALCCVPIPGGAVAAGASRLCWRGSIIISTRGHALVRIVSPSGKVFYRHMPGMSRVGKPITRKACDRYIANTKWWGKLFPEIPLRKPLDTTSTLCSPNCVWTAVRAIGNGL